MRYFIDIHAILVIQYTGAPTGRVSYANIVFDGFSNVQALMTVHPPNAPIANALRTPVFQSLPWSLELNRSWKKTVKGFLIKRINFHFIWFYETPKRK
jgi:hypothetical protein